jgi:formylmethanofuran dehydrogenase subunit E
MSRILRMRCQTCGHWNRVPVNKAFVEQNFPKPKVKVFIPMYEPLQVSKCEKCGKTIAQPKELIRIVKRS